MPDPDRLLRTLHKAVQAFGDTPGRRGRVVHLDGAEEVLAAGDLHGHVENFRRILLRADLGQYPRRHLVMQELIHGEFSYPNGGDKSHQVLDLLAALKCQYPARVHVLLGNHELAQWTGEWIAKGDVDLNDYFRQGIATAYAGRADEIYEAYLHLFAALPLAVRTPNRVFLSHSLPSAAKLGAFDPAILEREVSTDQDLARGGGIHALLWGRDTRPTTAAAFLEKVDADLLITGHIPCDHGFHAPNDRQLILDSMGAPVGYCLFPAQTPLTHQQLVDCVKVLG